MFLDLRVPLIYIVYMYRAVFSDATMRKAGNININIDFATSTVVLVHTVYMIRPILGKVDEWTPSKLIPYWCSPSESKSEIAQLDRKTWIFCTFVFYALLIGTFELKATWSAYAIDSKVNGMYYLIL